MTVLSDDVSGATMAIRRDMLLELKQKRSLGLIAYFSEPYIKTRKRFDNTETITKGTSVTMIRYLLTTLRTTVPVSFMMVLSTALSAT